MTKVPSAVLAPERDERDFVRGISSAIVPIVNVPSGDWSTWLPSNEPQKYKFDTDECTGVSFVNNVEIQLNWLKALAKMPQETVDWFVANGYIDDNGYFALSERFIGILSGTTINGNSTWAQWKTAKNVGILPRKDLRYSLAESQPFATQAQMCDDYYNPLVVTDAMRAKAKESLKYLSLAYEWVVQDTTTSLIAPMRSALKQAPLHISVPICPDVDWNETYVRPCTQHRTDHAITCYSMNPDDSFDIFDHYNPYKKVLMSGYVVPQVILGTVILLPPPPPVIPNSELSPATVSALLQWLKTLGGWIKTRFGV